MTVAIKNLTRSASSFFVDEISLNNENKFERQIIIDRAQQVEVLSSHFQNDFMASLRLHCSASASSWRAKNSPAEHMFACAGGRGIQVIRIVCTLSEAVNCSSGGEAASVIGCRPSTFHLGNLI